MEILKLDVVGSYSYKPDMKIVSYDGDNYKCTDECVICKRFLMEPSYEMLSDNKNITNDNKILIGKCGHMFHEDCLCKWLETSECCPIDKVKWHLHRNIDSTTNLVMHNSQTNSQTNSSNLKRKINSTNSSNKK